MILSDEAIVALLVVLGLILLLGISLFFGGLYLVLRARRVWVRGLGLASVLLVVVPAFGPWVLSSVKLAGLREPIASMQVVPETVPFAGAQILILDPNGDICGRVCEDLLFAEVVTEVFVGPLPSEAWEALAPNPMGGFEAQDDWFRVALGAPNAEFGGTRFAEGRPIAGRPVFDLLIIDDTYGLLSNEVPGALGLLGPEQLGGGWFSTSTYVFDRWPSEADLADPVARLVSVDVPAVTHLFWFLGGGTVQVPDYLERRAIWDGWICAAGGQVEAGCGTLPD